MRWLSILLLSLCFSLNSSLAQSPNEQEIRAVVQQGRQALIHHDAEAMKRLYADDFVALQADGTLIDKNTRLKSISELKTKSLEYQDLKIRLDGSTAIVTGISSVRAEGKADRSLRFIQVWVKQDSDWREVALSTANIRSVDQH